MDWKTFFEPVIRHALTGFGLWLVGHHMLVAVDPSIVQELTGVAMTLAGIAWSVGQKKGWFSITAVIIIVVAAGVGPDRAYAADMPPAPVVKARVLQTYQGSGWYWGIHTFVENQKITTVDTAALGGTFAVGAAVGGTLGYMRGGNGVSWQALEAMASYKNIAGGVPVAGDPMLVNSKWSFTQRVKFGGPVDAMLAALPNMGTIFPALPTLTGGVGTTHPYLFGAVHEDDISESINLPIGRAWRLKGGFGLGMMQQLGKAQNNPNASTVVADVWAEYIPPSSTVTFGVPAGFIKTNAGRETRIGLSILY